MNAFVTGSNAYGTPHEKSDLDIVALVSEEDAAIIKQYADTQTPVTSKNKARYPGDHVNVRIGNVNLLAMVQTSEFTFWRDVTEELKEAKPVTREEAVAYFAARRAEVHKKLAEQAMQRALDAKREYDVTLLLNANHILQSGDSK